MNCPMSSEVARPDERDLSAYEITYRESTFEVVQAAFRKRMLVGLLEQLRPRRILEVGCGLDTLANHWTQAERFVIVEPGRSFAEEARRATHGRPDVEVVGANLEDAADRLGPRFDLILLSGLLTELTDCAPVLAATRSLCGADTVVHVNVTNARSFHRLLALEMGLVDNLLALSDLQHKLQQHRVFTSESLRDLMVESGFAVFEEGDYFVKPFTHAQMQALADQGVLTPQMLEGLWGMAKHLPGLGSEIYVNVRRSA